MTHFDIENSKVYLPYSKSRFIISIVLNLSVIIIAIDSILSILDRGVTASNISEVIIAIAVATAFKRSRPYKEHYEQCSLSIDLDSNRMIINYLLSPIMKNTIVFDTIQSLEYSDQLNCLRLVCNYQTEKKKTVEKKENEELLLYVEYEENTDFYATLQSLVNKEIVFVDRSVIS